MLPAMIATDVDGTLLDENERVTDRTRNAVHAAVAAAVVAGILALASTSNNGVWFELPIIALGGGLKGGRVLDYTGKPDRQLCRLFLSMMDRMQVRPKTFGDAKTRLEEV